MTLPVYLVDDDDAVRRALGLLLSTIGIDVKGFADPLVFLAQLPRLPPRLPDPRHQDAGDHGAEAAGEAG